MITFDIENSRVTLKMEGHSVKQVKKKLKQYKTFVIASGVFTAAAAIDSTSLLRTLFFSASAVVCYDLNQSLNHLLERTNRVMNRWRQTDLEISFQDLFQKTIIFQKVTAFTES